MLKYLCGNTVLWGNKLPCKMIKQKMLSVINISLGKYNGFQNYNLTF